METSSGRKSLETPQSQVATYTKSPTVHKTILPKGPVNEKADQNSLQTPRSQAAAANIVSLAPALHKTIVPKGPVHEKVVPSVDRNSSETPVTQVAAWTMPPVYILGYTVPTAVQVSTTSSSMGTTNARPILPKAPGEIIISDNRNASEPGHSLGNANTASTTLELKSISL